MLKRFFPVGIFETKIEVINGISSAPSTAFYYCHCLEPGSDGRVIDVKFLNDDVLLALCHSRGMPQTLRNALPFGKTDLYYPKTESRTCDAYCSGR